MKFQSRKDIVFSSVILGLIALLLSIAIIGLVTEEMDECKYWTLIPIPIFIGFFFWLYFGTNYELTKTEFIYRCGPFNGKISLGRITEIGQGNPPWIGLKYATARNGLRVKYDKHNEIYISPKTNESFIEKILELNNEIKITE
ncbi:PH domain-containing protein [Maribacter sp. CXY002]|uniref:PH domain-containing protein n=1 Tax=Maribacter luteocoastalis TaxID=3407671 RepID=UPI003B673A8F